ncbi:hypothetical protein [uncultured Tenacibaculum sp.]|uniref:hypothetical protein n=1 Tax=uncultured Tenacibaculum sp. TaxID=174713 RepID=UPI0026219501|nr:hypothetical protein [uncultured Tenacibaculum sp.]
MTQEIQAIQCNFVALANIAIKEADSYSFNLNQLPAVNNYNTDIREDQYFKSIFEALNKKEQNCLYWFELESEALAIELNHLLDAKREELKRNLRVVPVKNSNTHSKVLYVGIRRGGIRKRDKLTNISGRIIQHLGYYEKGSTQGLQLVHWAKDTGKEIKLYVIELNGLDNAYLNALEKIIADRLNPLCGRH